MRRRCERLYTEESRRDTPRIQALKITLATRRNNVSYQTIYVVYEIDIFQVQGICFPPMGSAIP